LIRWRPSHAAAAAADPTDRLIVAIAWYLGATLLTADRAILNCGSGGRSRCLKVGLSVRFKLICA